MILYMFTVFDSKVAAYHRPFYADSVASAKRMIVQTSLDTKSLFYSYPADYTVFKLGEFDDQTGKISMLDSFENLGNIISLAAAENENLNLSEALERITPTGKL